MNQVKRVEAQGLLHEMKHFAFGQSPSFASGEVRGVEITKRFYHVDPLTRTRTPEISHEMCQSLFEFAAWRMPPNKNRPSYCYSLRHRIRRSLPMVTDHALARIPPHLLKKYDGLEEIQEGGLQEQFTTTFNTSEYELRSIDTSTAYKLMYLGKTLFRSTSDDILFPDARPVEAPAEESDEEAPYVYVGSRPAAEKLPPGDAVETENAFMNFAEPLYTTMPIDNWRQAALAIRGIMRTIETGEIA